METKKTLIRAALKRIDWKAEYGVAVQIGIEGSVEDINEIAGWLSEIHGLDTILIDDCKSSKPSLLSGLKAVIGEHYRVPPTVNGRVKLFVEPPELSFPIHFLSVPTAERYGLEAIIGKVRKGTVIYGSRAACADVLEASQLSAQPLFHCGDMLAVRAA